MCLGNIYVPLKGIRVEQVGKNTKVYLDRADHIRYVRSVIEERIGVKLVRVMGIEKRKLLIRAICISTQP